MKMTPKKFEKQLMRSISTLNKLHSIEALQKAFSEDVHKHLMLTLDRKLKRKWREQRSVLQKNVTKSEWMKDKGME